MDAAMLCVRDGLIFLILIGLIMFCPGFSAAQTYTPESLHSGAYWSPDGRKLAFAASYYGSYDIYVIDVNTTDIERISYHPSNNLYPAWSPSGRSIAFYSDRETTVPPFPPDTVIYKVKNLYETYARDGYKPSWSPNGRRIVAHLRSERGNYEIYTMNSSARDRRPLTNNDATDIHPKFSPDGKRIIFVSGRDYQPEIYVMNADGSDQIRLTNSKSFDIDPLWSPDGKKIVFISNRDGHFDIYTMNADGSDLLRLTDSPFYDISPVWSPGGNQILFSSNRNGYFNLYIINADGSGLNQLTDSEYHEYYGAWSPDGKQIAYLSTEGGEPHVYIMKPDGSDKRDLTKSGNIYN